MILQSQSFETWSLTESLMILSNMTSGGTWKSKTKYCREGRKYEVGEGGDHFLSWKRSVDINAAFKGRIEPIVRAVIVIFS